jgi:maltose/maltodextrin transport system substrate-binding protein
MNDDKQLGVAALNSFEKKLEADPKIGSRIAATRANAEVGHPMPNVAEMNRFWSSFQTALTNSTKGRQTVDEALSTAERRIEQ